MLTFKDLFAAGDVNIGKTLLLINGSKSVRVESESKSTVVARNGLLKFLRHTKSNTTKSDDDLVFSLALVCAGHLWRRSGLLVITWRL